MKFDSVVIGAGLAGMASALLLAKRGERVLLLEQHSVPAPVVRGFRRNGNYFDSGFHYAGGLAEDGPLRRFLRHLGLEQGLELFPFAEDGFDLLRCTETGQQQALPVGREAIQETMAQAFPGSGAAVADYLEAVERECRQFPYIGLERDFSDLTSGQIHGPSLSEALGRFRDWPLLEGLFSMHSLLYGVAPAEARFSFHALVAGPYYDSVHGIKGGGRSLSEAFLRRLEETGVALRCRARVEMVLGAAGKVTGVRLAGGEEITCRRLVSTVNPVQLVEMLPAGMLRPAFTRRLRSLRQTTSAYVLFARSRVQLPQLAGRNLFLQRQSGSFDFHRSQSLEQRPLYLTGADQSGSQDGTTGLVAICPADYNEVSRWGDSRPGRRPADYLEWKDQLSEQLLRLIGRDCPELADGLETVDLATPLTMRDYSLAPEGSLYGVGHYLGQYNPFPMTRVEGLLLAGQATAGPGLMGAVMSAYLACGSIYDHETLLGELQACR